MPSGLPYSRRCHSPYQIDDCAQRPESSVWHFVPDECVVSKKFPVAHRMFGKRAESRLEGLSTWKIRNGSHWICWGMESNGMASKNCYWDKLHWEIQSKEIMLQPVVWRHEVEYTWKPSWAMAIPCLTIDSSFLEESYWACIQISAEAPRTW